MSTHKHICDATVITCIDYRLHQKNAIADFLKKKFKVKTYDLITRPGSVKALAKSSDAIIADILNQISVSYNLHESRKIFLINHNDCGAYGIADPQKEKEEQLMDMETARDILNSNYRNLEIVKIWAHLKDPDGKEIEFEKID